MDPQVEPSRAKTATRKSEAKSDSQVNGVIKISSVSLSLGSLRRAIVVHVRVTSVRISISIAMSVTVAFGLFTSGICSTLQLKNRQTYPRKKNWCYECLFDVDLGSPWVRWFVPVRTKCHGAHQGKCVTDFPFPRFLRSSTFAFCCFQLCYFAGEKRVRMNSHRCIG